MMLQAKLMAMGAHFLKNGFKYALIGIAVWFLYGEIRTWITNFITQQQNVGKMEQVIAEQKSSMDFKDAEIATLKASLEIAEAANDRNEAKIDEVQNENDEFRERIARHDIDAIIARRGAPVVERAYTSGTNRYFGVWDTETRSLRNYGRTDESAGAGTTGAGTTASDEHAEGDRVEDTHN